MTNEVSVAFQKILTEIGPVKAQWAQSTGWIPYQESATIDKYEVAFNPSRKEFTIAITEIHAESYSPESCPHVYLKPITGPFNDQLHLLIKEFREQYQIWEIKNPKNYCKHQ